MATCSHSPSAADVIAANNVAPPPPRPFLEQLKCSVKETFFPDDPFRRFRHRPWRTKLVMGLRYFVPITDWLPRYTCDFLKADVLAGITIASLAIPQGISYAKLANLPPILGLYSSFVPPLIYAIMGSSRDLAVGNVAVPSLLMSSMLGREVDVVNDPKTYLRLAFTATFFAGVFQSALGILRLGFIVDLLSRATIVGFMGGAATVVCLQQLKGILGLDRFTHQTDLVSVVRSVFGQTHEWRWETALLGCSFLLFLLLTKYYSKNKPKLFWFSAMAPLSSIIVGSLLVYLTHADRHGVQVIGHLKQGINPITVSDLEIRTPFLTITLKTGMVTGMVALAEGIAVGRSFAMFKNYCIDGNKEMVAFGLMNMAGSFTSCYLTSGPFSRSAVNFNAGCKTAASNIFMAVAVMIVLLFLTPLFHYTPLVVLASIIISAMLGLIDYEAAIGLWNVDKFDFVICISAYFGVVFANVEIGLTLAVSLSLIRVLLFMVRPRVTALGNIPNSVLYRAMDQYPVAMGVPGILLLQIDAPIYFANANYLRERILRWVAEEEERLRELDKTNLHYVILSMAAVGNIDTSGARMLEETKTILDRRGLFLVLVNPGGEVMKKLTKAKVVDFIGREWIFLTAEEAVRACNFALHTSKSRRGRDNVNNV